jgi:hypothetical protein
LLSIPEERQQRELKQAQDREASERQRVRTLVIPLAIFAFWQLLGALFMLMSAHANDEKVGQAYFAAAFAVGYGGAFFSLMVYYVRGRERDDW